MKTCVCRTPVVTKVSEKDRRCTTEKCCALSICFRNSNEVKAKKIKAPSPPYAASISTGEVRRSLSLSLSQFFYLHSSKQTGAAAAAAHCLHVIVSDQPFQRSLTRKERERESTTTAIQDTRQHGHRARQACDTDSVGQGRRRQVDGVM